MDKAHIKLDLSRLSVADQIVLGRKIAQGLLGSDLADKTALAAAVTGATNQLQADETAAKLQQSESEAAHKTRDTSETNYADVMGDTATTVEKATAFNAEAMQAIGYALASTNRASAEMTRVLDVQISPGDYAGQLHPHWHPVKGARSYEVQMMVSDTLLMDEAAWKNGTISTESKCDLNGLPSHQLVWIRVRAIGAGSGNVGPWSDAASMSAQ